MPAGKKQHISRYRAQAAYHAIGPRRGFGWRFPFWTAVAEQFPVGALRPDLGGAAPLVFTIVPFDQIMVDFSQITKVGQFTSPLGTLQRAGKHLGKTQPTQPFLEPARVALPTFCERQVGKSRVLARESPGGFAMPGEVNDLKPLIDTSLAPFVTNQQMTASLNTSHVTISLISRASVL